MPLDHSAADYECVDPFWTYGLNREDMVILKTLLACHPVPDPGWIPPKTCNSGRLHNHYRYATNSGSDIS